MHNLFKHFLLEEAGDKGGGGGGGLLDGKGGAAGGGDGAAGGAGDKTPPPDGKGGDKGGASGGAALTLPENWQEQLPDDLKSEASLKLFKDIPSLAKSLVHAQKAIGADKIPLPGKHATDADWQAFYAKTGVPQDVKEYNVEVPKDAHMDDDMVAGFKEAAMKAGVHPRQAQAILKWYGDANKAVVEGIQGQTQAEQQKEVQGLKDEWGQAFARNLLRANQALVKFGGKEGVAALQKAGLHNNVHVIRLLAKVGESIQEDTIGEGGGGSSAMTPAEAQKEYTRIIGDMKGPYYDKRHPGHAAAVAEVQSLFQMAYPEKKEY